ncbi:MAG: response regulator [Desulfobacteraceae bacterium]|jgi:DNA-binding response OmpR family regulator
MGDVIKIMVVDDEAGICRNVEKILTKNDFEVTSATSAREALEIMQKESFNLMITDIVMPQMNGLELLKKVKSQWPETKALTMTAFASTDTAHRAIRLGALDYLPKPFTPVELRDMVNDALSGKLVEARVTAEERNQIDVIDVDVPFDSDEVAEQTGEEYTKMLGRGDMPVVEVKISEPIEGFCEVGAMVCDIFKKLGATCKAGVKTSVCPQLKKKKKAKAKGPDVKNLVGVDQPFSYEEVVGVTGPEYVKNLQTEGVALTYYEELKANVARMDAQARIDVDVPFDWREVEKVTGEAYARQVTRTDMPAVEITSSETLEGFCETGAMVCDIFKKLGATCKAGTKTGACPQLKKKARAKARSKAGFDPKTMISVDMPFDIKEVAAVTGPDYINYAVGDSLTQMPYAQLKANYEKLLADDARQALVDTNLILVIDDEVAVNNNIRKILGKTGYGVDQATTKEEALEKINNKTYALILLDLKIPGVQGLELLQLISDRQPRTKVIMITGYASVETAKEAARLGAIEYLPKPFTPNEIREATDRAFRFAA